jgi:capsular polysaccharide biosynthesis protein
MLASGWLVILCATGLSAAAAVVAARYLQEPVYAASAQLFAVVPGDAQTHAAYEGNRGASVRMQTYSQLATSTMVTQRTIDELGLRQTPAELAEHISTRSVPDVMSRFSYPLSVLLDVQVTGGDREQTVETANALARNLVAASEELEWNGSESGPALVLIDEAKSAQQAGESWIYHAGVGGGLGLTLSALAVLALGVRRDRILDRDQIAYLASGSAAGDEVEGTS